MTLTSNTLQLEDQYELELCGKVAQEGLEVSSVTAIDEPGLDGNDLVESIEQVIGQPCVIVDPAKGVLESISQQWPQIDLFRWMPLCEQVARYERPEVIEEHAPLLLLAIPIKETDDSTERVAVSLLLTEKVSSISDIESAARVFDIPPEKLFAWSRSQPVWPAKAAICLVETLFENYHLKCSAKQTQDRCENVSNRMVATFEELNLLYRLTEQISLDRSVRDLCEEVVDWLSKIVPSSCLVARWYTHDDDEKNLGSIDVGDARTIVTGELPFDLEEIDQFYDRLGPDATRRAVMLDSQDTSSPTWRYPKIKEVICVPIRTNERQVGWIAAINHAPKNSLKSSDFGTIQSSLLTSVCSILGVHAGNRTLFHRKENLLDSAVRCITSAIDAKDSYTSGHSDRVARIAVRLARQLGCSEEDQKAMYLGGLLHDVGKIGIDDDILSKPGSLSPQEYDHIKQHPSLGAKIVEEVDELKHILPVILHHHEAWDGSGYPAGLRGEECPNYARIMAVADAFDAMGSDRPYRKGMPFEKIERIFKEGAGKQWDPKVIDAYFEAKDEIQVIAQDGLLGDHSND